MPHHNLQEPLQPLPPVLNHIIAKTVRKHLPRQRRYGHARRLALEDVAEVLKVAVAPAHGRVLELEGGDVGAAHDFVVGVHGARCAVGLGVFDLSGGGGDVRVGGNEEDGLGGVNYFDFEKVFGGAVDFFKGLLAGVRHGLHGGRGGGDGSATVALGGVKIGPMSRESSGP